MPESERERIRRVTAEPVSIVDYDDGWPAAFESEKRHLLATLPPDVIVRIEHFGSTAVPGLAAKPIIDMLVEVTDLDEVRTRVVPLLTAQGYEYFWRPTFGDSTPPYYAWFIKRDPASHERTHHIHMVEADFAEHWDRLLFRDYLVEHPDAAHRYERMKRDAASAMGDDRVAYTAAKTEFIAETTALARIGRAGAPRTEVTLAQARKRDEQRGLRAMRTSIVLTLTGPDRLGIVEDVTRVLLDADANIETSRMAHLGGEFAILMLATMPAEQLARIDASFANLTDEGYTLSARETKRSVEQPHVGWDPYRIEVRGADHEGIVHEIAQGLSQSGINIESMETGTVPAPVSGALLFTMRAVVAVPRTLSEAEWTAELVEACRQANVDVTITVAEDDWDAAR